MDAVGPVGPESIVVSGATVSTVQVRVASLASALPAASRARTRKVWLPSPSPVSVRGELQASQAPASSLHSKVAPPSLDENVKAAVVAETEPVGPPLSVVSGAFVSTVQVRVAALASRLPAASTRAHAEGVGPVGQRP